MIEDDFLNMEKEDFCKNYGVSKEEYKELMEYLEEMMYDD